MKDDRASATALFVAAVSFANGERSSHEVVPATRELGERVLGLSLLGRCLRALVKRPWGLRLVLRCESLVLSGFMSHVMRRKAWFELKAREWAGLHPTGTLMVVGAGFDGLAWECSRKKLFGQVLEVDHPATQQLKRQVLRESEASFLPLDLSKHAVTELAAQIPQGVPTLVVWEGVSMYLREREVQVFLRELSSMLMSGSEILFTYMEPDSEGKIQFHRGKGVINFVLKRMKEPFTWGLRPEQLASFLGQTGWKLIEDSATTVLPGGGENPCQGERLARAVKA